MTFWDRLREVVGWERESDRDRSDRDRHATGRSSGGSAARGALDDPPIDYDDQVFDYELGREEERERWNDDRERNRDRF